MKLTSAVNAATAEGADRGSNELSDGIIAVCSSSFSGQVLLEGV